MQCPKCGTENPDKAHICNVCGLVFKNGGGEKPASKPKISRLAIASFVFSFLSVLLFFLAGIITSIILGIMSISQISKSGGKLKGKSFAIAGITISVFLTLTFFLWSIDAAPVPDDYTISDIRSASPQYRQSYELLSSLADQEENLVDAPAIGLSAQDVNTIERVSNVFKEGNYSQITEVIKENAEGIRSTWTNAKKARDIVNELDRFPEIADLTEPNLCDETNFHKNLILLMHLYEAFAYLQNEQGNSPDAVNELIKFDSVFRKLSINARFTITKVVCFSILATDIITANSITNSPHASQESLELLTKHFTPLTDEQISMRNSIIFDYLACKNELTKFSRDLKPKYTSSSPVKLNSTLRLCKNCCDKSIAIEENRQEIKELTVWPTIYPNIPVTFDSNGRVPRYYLIYNPIGSLMAVILMPDMKVFERKTKHRVYEDLLQIVFNKRLGKEVSLKARAYSDRYIIDKEKKKIFSPGPDGKIDTKDDIELMINPEVLKLTD